VLNFRFVLTNIRFDPFEINSIFCLVVVEYICKYKFFSGDIKLAKHVVEPLNLFLSLLSRLITITYQVWIGFVWLPFRGLVI
jgi:hypothetical protein